MKLLFLLLGVAFFVFQAEAQVEVVKQGEDEAKDLGEMEEEAEDEIMDAEDAAGMESPGEEHQ